LTLLLKDQPSEALAAHLEGVVSDRYKDRAARLARRLQVLSVQRGLGELPDFEGEFGRTLWGEVRGATRVPHIEIVDRVTSARDGFTKYLFAGEGGRAAGTFEAVRIPLLHRAGDEKYVVCVSSQVGCTAGCAFCATGRLGFKRQLATWEIVDQVVKISQESPYPVKGVVFMGMGEPLLNYDRVLKAARVLAEPTGMAICGRGITISTVGIPRQMRRFAAEKLRYRLITSLHSAIAEKRDQLVPINQAYPLTEVFDALRFYYATTRRRVVLAWTMISGVNMDREEAKALAALTKDLPIILDLIPVNDGTGRFAPPEMDEYVRFLRYVEEEVKCPVVRRYSGGQDIQGACGMLAGEDAAAPDVAEALPAGAVEVDMPRHSSNLVTRS
jgi:23S rRNA (adenine2503-C2)-methyltransferase